MRLHAVDSMCSFRGPSDVFARLCTIKRVPLCRCSSYTLPCTWWYAVGSERLRCGLGLHPTRELSGKNAVNRGAGYETSLRLAKEGAPVVLATVVLAGRSLAKLADAPDGSCARTRSAASVKSVEGKTSVVAYRRLPRPASVSGSSSSVSRRLSGSSSNNPRTGGGTRLVQRGCACGTVGRCSAGWAATQSPSILHGVESSAGKARWGVVREARERTCCCTR